MDQPNSQQPSSSHRADALRDYEQGLQAKAICHRYGISTATLYTWVHEEGLDTRGNAGRKPKEPLTTDQCNRAIDMYRGRASLAEIASSFGISTYMLERSLRERGMLKHIQDLQNEHESRHQALGKQIGERLEAAVRNGQSFNHVMVQMKKETGLSREALSRLAPMTPAEVTEKRHQFIIETYKNNPFISCRDCAKLCGCTRNTVSEVLRQNNIPIYETTTSHYANVSKVKEYRDGGMPPNRIARLLNMSPNAVKHILSLI